jgi:hypothetical protein
MLANPGTVFFSCLAVVVGDIEHLLLHGLLDSLVDETGPATANLAARNQSVRIFLDKGQNSSQSQLRYLDLVLMALRGILALQSSMAIFFSLLRRVCLSSHM